MKSIKEKEFNPNTSIGLLQKGHRIIVFTRHVKTDERDYILNVSVEPERLWICVWIYAQRFLYVAMSCTSTSQLSKINGRVGQKSISFSKEQVREKQAWWPVKYLSALIPAGSSLLIPHLSLSPPPPSAALLWMPLFLPSIFPSAPPHRGTHTWW